MRHIFLATLLISACASSREAGVVASRATESKVEVCVVDTIAPGGMMPIGAIHVHATNDTLVLQSSGRVPLRQIVRGPKVLSEAKWITSKEPLQLTAASGKVRFVASGAPRPFALSKIVLLGMMRGLPLFAAPAEVTPVRPEIESLAARGIDLEKALAQRVTLRRQLDKIKTLYAPVSLTGCTFQALTKEVRRRR
jgi:hypothetical protein